MRKWCTNSSYVLSHIPQPDRASESILEWDKEETIKTLGIAWNPTFDNFQFSVHFNRKLNTKRTILSEIARIYDPLGLIGPLITNAKIFMQSLWLLDETWDQCLPQHTCTKWESICNAFDEASAIKIPRKIFTNSQCHNLQLHTFTDASEKAYGACIYMRSEIHGHHTVNL